MRSIDCTIIYKPDTLISQFTNVPVTEPTYKRAIRHVPTFWCSVCNIKLDQPANAVLHMYGRRHKIKFNLQKTNENGKLQNGTLKRKMDIKNEKGFSNKRNKDENGIERAEIIETCDVCEMEFESLEKAIEHYKGNKHVENVYRKKEGEPLDQSWNCEICDLDFLSAVDSIKHFKSGQHVAMIEGMYEERNSK